MGTTQRQFGTGFKREAVRQSLQSGHTVATVAQDQHMHESVPRRWLKEDGSGPRDKATSGI